MSTKVILLVAFEPGVFGVAIYGSRLITLLSKRVRESLFCGIGTSTYKKKLKVIKGQLKVSVWKNFPGSRLSKVFPQNCNKQKAKARLELNRNTLHVFTGLLAGHCLIGKQMATIDLKQNSGCRFCWVKNQSLESLTSLVKTS